MIVSIGRLQDPKNVLQQEKGNCPYMTPKNVCFPIMMILEIKHVIIEFMSFLDDYKDLFDNLGSRLS